MPSSFSVTLGLPAMAAVPDPVPRSLLMAEQWADMESETDSDLLMLQNRKICLPEADGPESPEADVPGGDPEWLLGTLSAAVQQKAAERDSKNVGRKVHNQSLTKGELLMLGESYQFNDAASDTSGTMASTAGSSHESPSTCLGSRVVIEDWMSSSGELPSIGSERHSFGDCKPCLFAHTRVGCDKGASCNFCHLVHNRRTKARPCKGKRERYRKLVARMALEHTVPEKITDV